ncbi:hypothetical protein LY78DRAFT_660940 [Colletotrichum sublineola]|uniref:Uncharacterized protein n=1 Tax=Colletotrichum sublineola TaxID=1173701 RepID=A0A066XEL1_COLSU|nr:hypothetical protein LY78DRAFT_660940 [Colletotrichum sublineola]KDN64465.1 hypothetical protein CSUB01_00422 [Colletotrichum sublineola]
MPTKMPLGSPSGQDLTCKVPNCHTKPFASNYNLQRHIKNVHNPDAVITMPCGTPIGPRSKDMSNVTRHIKTCVVHANSTNFTPKALKEKKPLRWMFHLLKILP